MDRSLRIYIAGPYTHGDVALNVRQAMEAAVEIIDAGHVPFVPHLYHFLHCCFPQPYEVWMRLDLRWLSCCHALLRLPGDSPGADREADVAVQMGLPIYHDVHQLLDRLPLHSHTERTVS